MVDVVNGVDVDVVYPGGPNSARRKKIRTLTTKQQKSLIKKYGPSTFKTKVVPKIRSKVSTWYKHGVKNINQLSNGTKRVKLGSDYYDLVTGRFN